LADTPNRDNVTIRLVIKSSRYGTILSPQHADLFSYHATKRLNMFYIVDILNIKTLNKAT
jgi:hypothetical protein